MRILYISLFYLSVNAVYGQFHFAEKQSEAGIDHFVEHREFMGGGATFFDFDLDGDEDLYITSGFLRDHFYINNGDGTFTNEARERGFRDTDLFYTTGVIAGDIDNDGYKDLYVNTWRSNSQNFARNLLFHNNGDGTFTEIWEQSGGQDEAFTMGSVFIDYNLDGLLDIYVVTYVENRNVLLDENGIPNGFAHDCFSNSLYLNKGEGVFEKVIDQPTLDNAGCALAVTASDYDADGDLDIYLANDFGEFILPNSLFQNNEGVFTDVAEETGADIGIFGMGIAVGDIDMDLDLDYYVTNLGRNVLLQNEEGGFNDITTTAGVENSWVIQDALRTTGWGTAFLDFDNDMDLDLFVSNGVIPADEFIATSIPDPNKLYENDGTGNFTDVSAAANVENLTIGRGLATADYDNDGDVDVLNVVLRGTVDGQVGETILYQNQLDQSANWLQVQLEGVSVNRDAYGSKIYAYAGDRILMREISGGSSHASHNSAIAHFGLDQLNQVDSLEVVWTGGVNSQTLYDLSVNQRINVVEDTSSISTFTFEIFEDQEIVLSPNPVEDILNISLTTEVAQIRISTIDGILMDQFLPVGQKNISHKIDLPNGIYLVEFIGQRKRAVRKLIVQN